MAIDRDKLLQAAAKLVEKGKYDKAIAEYRKIVQNDPGDARTLLKIGDLQSRQRDFAGAVQTYDRVATYYASQGFQLKAIAVFKQIREIIRKHAPQLSARYSHVTPRLADIYAELNLVTDALAAYDEVATSFQKAGRDHDAIEVFKKTVQLDPKNPLPHLRLAEAQCRVKALNEAIDSFWTAAELLLGLKRPDDALKVIERILHFRADPVYARAAAKLYLMHDDAQAGMQALARLQIAFQANPKDLDTLALLAQAFEVIGQSEKALEVHLEMARLSRDQKKPALWSQIMDHLLRVAPQNEQVQALHRAGPPPGSLVPPSLAVEVDVEIDVEEAVDLDGDVEEALDLDGDVEYLDDEQFSSIPPGAESAQASAISSLPISRPPSVASPSIRGSQPDAEEAEGVEVAEGYGIDAEEKGAPQSFQPSTHAHKALSDAEQFRSMGLLDKAVEALHIALEIDPNSIPIRQKLREILVEAGERNPAIAETLNIAIIHVHNQNPEEAAPLAEEVLEIEPGHPDALNILEHVAALREAQAALTDDGTLSSYDMEGVRPSAAINESLGAEDIEAVEEISFLDEEAPVSLRGSPGFQPAGQPNAPASGVPLSGVPISEAPLTGAFGSLPRPVPPPTAPPRTTSPLSSSPLSAGPLSAPPLSVPFTQPLGSSLPPSGLAGAVRPSSIPPALRARPTPEAIEEVLEEAEFFAAQGLYSDAIAILTEMLESAPNHVLLQERLDEVRGMAPEPTNDERDSLLPEDNAFDIAASLDALDDLDEPTAAPEIAHPDQEVDVDQVFAKFKEGVKSVVDDGDSATHYDLGLAYKEMGLLEDACSEFELASNDPGRTCMCCSMIGAIRREQGDMDAALAALQRALAAPEQTANQTNSIEYDLALLADEMGEQAKYVSYLQSVAARDRNYRDVAARIRALGEAVPANSDEDDDFEAAFENLLGS